MAFKSVLFKIYLIALLAIFGVWNLYGISKIPLDERTFATIGAVLFSLMYLLPPALFGADLKAAEDGVHVEHYSKAVIPYSEIRGCYSFYQFPWQVMVLTTKRKFPLNILYAGDKLTGQSRSLVQDGELAARVKAKIVFSNAKQSR